MARLHDRVVEIPLQPRVLHDRTLNIPSPSWPWGRLVVTHLVAVCAGLVLAAGIYSLVRWDGRYFDAAGGGGVSGPMLVGQAVTTGFDLSNNGDKPIVLERVAPASPPESMRILGLRVELGHAVGGFIRTWNGRSTPVRGVVIPPHTKTAGVTVGFRFDQPGIYMIKGVRVWYQAGPNLPLLGRGHFVQTTGQFVGVCVVRKGTCEPPSLP